MSWRLIFTGIQSWGWTLTIAAAVGTALGLFLTLRKYETRLVSPTVSRTLLVLRVILLTLLVVVLLQPVLTRQWDIERRSRLVVAVDVSRSMDTSDRHAAPEEMLRWGQALGMLGNASTAAMLEEWAQAYASGNTPDFGNGDRQLGRVRQEQLDGVFAEIARMPRTEFVRRLLLASPNDLLKQLSEIQPVDLRAFGGEELTISAQQIPDLLKSDRLEIRPGATDAAQVLSSVVAESDGVTVEGIVLFTDGRQTESADFESEVRRLQQLQIPVYTVPIGSRLLPRDLSIAALEYPETVFLDDTAEVRATVTSTGYSGEDVVVVLTRDGVPVDERRVTVAADYFDVTFAIAADEAGSFSYGIETEVRPGELREDNNTKDFTVSVVDNKSRVMLVEGDPRWEFRYLKGALERDKRVDLSVILLNPPYLQLLNRPFIDNEFPDTESVRQQLSQADILILGDIPPDTIPDASWQAIEEAVSEDGLTLLFVPGKQHLPHQHSSQVLRDLLPVTDTQQQVAERLERTLPNARQSAFRLSPTPSAADLTLFRLTTPGEERGMTLEQLPGHPWAYTGQAKPGATVWANLKLPTRQLSKELPGVVHQYYGFGQTVWLGVDSTWRWRRRAGDRWHHRFWGQVVRWAAQNKAAAGNDQIRFSLSDVVVEESESVSASVRWDPKLVGQLADAQVSIVITPQPDPQDDEEPAAPQTIPLVASQSAPERYAADLPLLSAGTYDVRVEVDDNELTLDQEIASELIVQQKISTELANVSCNRELLQQIAEGSEGSLLEPWDLASLPDLVRPEEMSTTEIKTESLWDKWPVLALFFVVLSLEWVVRKLNGLP